MMCLFRQLILLLVRGLAAGCRLHVCAATTIQVDFDQDGGTLVLDILSNDTRDKFTIPPGGLSGDQITTTITDNDNLYVIGTATLDGTLEFDLNGVTSETYAWYDVVVANDIQITDGTLDLQGMAIWRIIDDPSNPGREILQVAIPEPASVALWGLLGVVMLVAFGRRRYRRG